MELDAQSSGKGASGPRDESGKDRGWVGVIKDNGYVNIIASKNLEDSPIVRIEMEGQKHSKFSH